MNSLEKKLGLAIREYRKSQGLTQKQLAAQIGVAQNTVSAWERGEISTMRNWERLADLMGVDHERFKEVLAQTAIKADKTQRMPAVVREIIGTKLPTTKNNATILHVAAQPSFGARDVPVLGRAVGGLDGRYEFNGGEMGYEVRPAELAGVSGAYAIYADGESMYPRYKAGETLWINPHVTPRRGDDVVVQIWADREGEPDYGFIKEFVCWRADKLVLQQHNPPGEIVFDRRDVKSLHKVVFTNRP